MSSYSKVHFPLTVCKETISFSLSQLRLLCSPRRRPPRAPSEVKMDWKVSLEEKKSGRSLSFTGGRGPPKDHQWLDPVRRKKERSRLGRSSSKVAHVDIFSHRCYCCPLRMDCCSFYRLPARLQSWSAERGSDVGY